jgi:hypothetical protein
LLKINQTGNSGGPKTKEACGGNHFVPLHTSTGTFTTVVVGIMVVVVVVANTSTVDVIVLVTTVRGVIEVKVVVIEV